jgi:hypothetical protein
LREKPISTARLKHPSPALLAAGIDPPKENSSSFEAGGLQAANESKTLTGLDELNLLDGLYDGKHV